MKWPHTDVGQKENHMPLPNSNEATFPHSEEQSPAVPVHFADPLRNQYHRSSCCLQAVQLKGRGWL